MVHVAVVHQCRTRCQILAAGLDTSASFRLLGQMPLRLPAAGNVSDRRRTSIEKLQDNYRPISGQQLDSPRMKYAQG